MGHRSLVCLETGRPLDPKNKDPKQDDARGEINQIRKTMEPYVTTDKSTQPTILNLLLVPFTCKRPRVQIIGGLGFLASAAHSSTCTFEMCALFPLLQPGVSPFGCPGAGEWIPLRDRQQGCGDEYHTVFVLRELDLR